MSAALQADEPAGARRARGADSWETLFTPQALAGMIGFMILAAYPEVVMGTHSFFYRDFGLFTCPVAWYHRAAFWDGRVPLWNPLSDCGLPFLAQWNTAVLYPPSLVYLLFPLPWSLNYLCLGHLMLAGLGMYLLALRWTGNRLAASVAGLAFSWNGLSVHCLMWISNLAALAWMPWVVLMVERAWERGGRRLVWAALVGAIQILSGAPEIILLTWLALGALMMLRGAQRAIPWRMLAGRLALVAALAGGLAAAQVLPFLHLVAHSDRTTPFNNNAWAMPWWGWANFLVPLFHCSPSILGVFSQDEQQWTSSYYMGIGVLALALCAVWQWKQSMVWLLAGFAVAGVLLAMGRSEPIYRGISQLVPVIGLMRYPIKFVVLTAFALPLLAAFGLARLQSAELEKETGAWYVLACVGAALLITIGTILFLAHRFPHTNESWPITWRSGASRAALLLLVLTAVFMLGRAKTPRMRGLLGLVILLVTGFDAVSHTPKQNPTVVANAYNPIGNAEVLRARLGESRAMVSPEAQAFLNHASTPDALNFYVGARRSLYLNCNLLDGIPSVHGFFSLYVKEEAMIYALLYNPTNVFPAALADFVGASQISAPGGVFQWTNRPRFMPLVTAGQQPEFASAEQTLRLLAAPEFDPRHRVYLPLAARGAVAATNLCEAKVQVRKMSAESIRADVEAARPTMVLVAQTFYDPWRAYVDDRPAQIWRANYAFQALEVPAGRHRVRLEYEDRWFTTGVMISTTSLFLCLGLWTRFGLMEKKRRDWARSGANRDRSQAALAAGA